MNGLRRGLIATSKQTALTDAGSAGKKPQADSEYPIGPNTLRSLYTSMLKCQMVEEHARRAAERPRSTRGREAIVVASTIRLRHGDYVAGSQHASLADIVRGKPLQSLFMKIESGRREWAAARSKRSAVSAATEFSIATGVALGFQMHRKHNVVIALSLGSVDSRDVWQEPARYAALHKLPIVFVVQGRVTKGNRRGRDNEPDLSRQAEKCGLPGIPVDESDAVAVYRVAHEAIDRARRGAGPALIECKTWTKGRVADPIKHMQQYLHWKGLWSEEWNRQVTEQIRREIKSAARR